MKKPFENETRFFKIHNKPQDNKNPTLDIQLVYQLFEVKIPYQCTSNKYSLPNSSNFDTILKAAIVNSKKVGLSGISMINKV